MNKHRKDLWFWLSAVIILIAVFLFFRRPGGAAILWQLSNSGQWLLPLVGIAAVIDSINPCAFSVLILTIAFLFSLSRERLKILEIGLSYIFGLFLVYIFIGLGILQTFHLFDTPHFMAKIGAVFLIAFGFINLINEFFPAFPLKLKIPVIAHQKIAVLISKSSVPAAFLLGVLVGLCEFPCTGGPYLMVLGLLHDQTTFLKGIFYLIFYNIIFVLPLIVILFLASNKMVVEKIQIWKKEKARSLHFWSGLLMILLGLLIFVL